MFRTMGHTETAKDELLKQLDDAAKGLQLTEPGKEKVDLESSGSDVASSTRLSVVSEDGDEEEFLRELEDNEVLPRRTPYNKRCSSLPSQLRCVLRS
jgi:hypothetical protein